MDVLDISTQILLEPIFRREKKEFIIGNKIRDLTDLRYLFIINYFIEMKGVCYDADIAWVKDHPGRKSPMPGVRLRGYAMVRRGLIKYIKSKDLHPVLKRCYTITDRGHSVMDNYLVFLRKQEKDLMYRIKKGHKEAREEV
jgi:hypothetical protein